MRDDFDDINQSALEGSGVFRKNEMPDVRILREAARYNVDLQSLETPPETETVADNVMPMTETLNNIDNSWAAMDVNLGEMAAHILDSSERMVVIVSDDKVVYLNKKARNLLALDDFNQGTGQAFLSFVDKSDWTLLAENIGEMLTSHKQLSIHLRAANNRIIPIELSAIYLPDFNRFSFILLSSHQPPKQDTKFNNLYDELTGLPNFFLFEDRVQMAVNNENYKDVRLPKDLIAVMGISIDNAEEFKKISLYEFVLKKIGYNLVMNLKKNATVARGLKYQFWILLPDVANEHDLEMEMARVKEVLKNGVSDNFTTHQLKFSIGASVFPNPAHSAKKLIEQAIFAVKKAQERKGNSLLLFDGQK